MAAVAEGVAEIRCEFCGQQYHFDADQIAELFRPHGIELAGPGTAAVSVSRPSPWDC